MTAVEVKRCVETIVERLADSSTPTRTQVERGVILPILQALGWDVFDTRAVQSGFPVGGAHVDLALCDEEARPQLFLEIHGSRFDPAIVPGVLSRARRADVSLVVLTNGHAWRLFLAETEADSAVPVFELNLSGSEVAVCAAMLDRYLRRHGILTGESLKDALASNALPAAWRGLVAQKDSLLVQLLADEVRDRVGVKPADAAVVGFLRRLVSVEPVRPVAARRKAKRKRNRQAIVTLLGQRSAFAHRTEAIVWLLTELHRRDPAFLQRLSKHPTLAKGVPRLAKSPAALSSRRHASLPDGWFLNLYSDTGQKEQQARAAAEVAGLKFGTDVVVDFRSP